jgi:hypothetical protein
LFVRLERPFVVGVIVGLLIGVLMCVLGFGLTATGGWFETAFGLVHWPLVPIFTRIFTLSVSHSWSYPFEVGLMSVIIVTYWAFIGLLVGLCYQYFSGKRGRHAA